MLAPHRFAASPFAAPGFTAPYTGGDAMFVPVAIEPAKPDPLACLDRPRYAITYRPDADRGHMMVRLHEAAHAVVAVRLGLIVQSLAFDADGGGGGTSIWFSTGESGDVLRCVVAAAGVVVNERFKAHPCHAQDDLDNCRVYMGSYHGAYGKPFPLDPLKTAADLIAEPALNLAIGRVADLLQPGVALSGEQVRMVFAECGGVSLPEAA